MSRFMAVLNASNPQLVADIEAANGRIVMAHEPGVLVIDGDSATAETVGQLQSVAAVGPVDQAWDTSSLGLSDDVATVVASWNVRYSDDFVAAASENYRGGEPWDFPGGCFHSGIEGDDNPLPPDADTGGALVADNGQTGTTDQGTTGTTGTTDQGTTDTGSTGSTDTGQLADNTGTGTTDQGTTGTTDPGQTDPPADGTSTNDGSIA